MANSLNRCEFIGRLGADPEIRYMPSGDPIVNFSIGVNHSKKDASGSYVDTVDWIKITAFGKVAQTCADWLKKGNQIYVAGRLSNKKWEKDGVTHYSNDIICDFMQMLGGKSDSQPTAQTTAKQYATAKGIADLNDDPPF
jgi:single-strand DNA-binding protein